jgi:carbonic anhydrase
MEGNNDRFIHYTGSLTTSPCTEGIFWILVSSAIEIRESSLNRLRTNIVASNYRVTQPLNGRSVQRNFPSALWIN